MERKKQLSPVSVAFLFVGAVMGAGFASGKEIFVFFGRYGVWGFLGIALVTGLFGMAAVCILKLSVRIPNARMEDIICPEKFGFFCKAVSWIMFFDFFIAGVAMLAAEGSIIQSKFAIPAPIGALILCLLVGFTVWSGAGGVIAIIRKVVPVVILLALTISVITIIRLPVPESYAPAAPQTLFNNFFLSMILYLSYNVFGTVPILNAVSARLNEKRAVSGGLLGGLFIGVCAFMLAFAMSRDLALVQRVDMPMLELAGGVSAGLSALYAVLLTMAIYSTATSCFFGAFLKVGYTSNKKRKAAIMIGILLLAYLLSLVGFTKIVTYFYPAQGVLGVLFIAFMFYNYYLKFMKKGKPIMQERQGE